MSSVRMKMKLGLTVVDWAAVGGLPTLVEMNTTANAADANSRMVLLILHSLPNYHIPLAFAVREVLWTVGAVLSIGGRAGAVVDY
jgi:hypothetical protein